MKRKFLAALLALVMVFSMIPVSASAAGDGEYDIVRLIERSEWQTAAFSRAGVEKDGVISLQRFFIYNENGELLNSGAAADGGSDLLDYYYADTEDIRPDEISRIVVTFTNTVGLSTTTVSASFSKEDFTVSETGGVVATKFIELSLTDRGKSVPSGHAVRFYAELNDETTYTLYDTVYVQDGQQIGNQMPNNPPVGSYVFLGWQTEKDDGTAVGSETYVYGDMDVYAAKGTAGEGHAQEYHVMSATEKRSNALAIEVADHYNAENHTSFGVESFTIDDIAVNGTNTTTNYQYHTDEWKNEKEYYYIYNVTAWAANVTPEYKNERVPVNDVTGITVYGKLNGNDYSAFIPRSELALVETQNNVVVEIRVREKLDGISKELVTTETVDAPTVAGITFPEPGETVSVPVDEAVTLMYKITVTGDSGSAYKITDEGAAVVDGYSLTGTIDHTGTATIYVTKIFTSSDVKNGSLINTASVVPGDDTTLGTDENQGSASDDVGAEVDDGKEDPEEPSVPGIDDIEQALAGNIAVACSTNTEHEMQYYGYVDGAISDLDSAKVEQDADGSYICKLTLDTGKYVGRYNEYHSGHTLVDPSTPVIITLHYTKKDGTGTWYMEAPVIIEVECNSGTTDPEKPDEGTVTGLLGNEAVLVQCDVADSGHARRYYPLLSGTFTIGDVENNTVKVTVDSNEYLKEYTLYSGKEHSEVIAQDENYFTLTWNGKDWTVSGNPVTFTVHCSTTEEPEEPTAPDVENILGPNAVEVLCVTNNGIHGSKTYGLLNGGYMEQGPDWITGQGEEDGYWQYVVTIDAGVYQAQFNTDTKPKHDLASPEETYLPITLIYRDNTWVIEGTEPYTTIKLVCDSEEPTLPEKPDDETIYDIFNGNKPVILACVTENSGHEEQAFDLLTNSYDIGEVKEIDGRYLCDITIVNVQDYIDIYNENTDKEHSLSPNQPDQVLTLKYVNGEWAIDDDGIVRYTVACKDTSTEPTPDPDPTPDPTPTPGPGGGDKPPYIPPVDPDDSGVSDLLNTDDHIQYLFGYPEGTFGPENNMTRAEVAQMFYNLLLDQDVTITKTFDDVPAGAWYAKAVNTLASLGVVSGVGNGDFEPERSITRAEFTSIAMKFAEGKTGGTNIFSDVKSTDWFYRAVVNSTQYGWIHGYGDGTFRPNNPITRVEVTAIVNNMLGREADVDFVTEHYDELNHFSDLAVSHWGYYHIVEATNDHDYTKPSSGENWTELN